MGDESIDVHVFVDLDAATAAAALVDRDDPRHIGNAHVEWAGTPRFWLRDRAVILYVGSDPALDAALRGMLGSPLAEGDAIGGRGAPGERRCERAV